MSRNSVSVTTHSAGPRIGRSLSRFFSMRPSHLVIEGGQPPLLKITVWLGNKAADKYRLAPLFGRADVGKIPHGHRWDLPRSEFAPDSPLEQAGFEPSVPARTAIACPPISLDSSSTKTTSGVRASRARFGQLADERIALRYR